MAEVRDLQGGAGQAHRPNEQRDQGRLRHFRRAAGAERGSSEALGVPGSSLCLTRQKWDRPKERIQRPVFEKDSSAFAFVCKGRANLHWRPFVWSKSALNTSPCGFWFWQPNKASLRSSAAHLFFEGNMWTSEKVDGHLKNSRGQAYCCPVSPVTAFVR